MRGVHCQRRRSLDGQCELLARRRRLERRPQVDRHPSERQGNAKPVPRSLERDPSRSCASHGNEQSTREASRSSRTRRNREARPSRSVDRERCVLVGLQHAHDRVKAPRAAARRRSPLDQEAKSRQCVGLHFSVERATRLRPARAAASSGAAEAVPRARSTEPTAGDRPGERGIELDQHPQRRRYRRANAPRRRREARKGALHLFNSASRFFAVDRPGSFSSARSSICTAFALSP